MGRTTFCKREDSLRELNEITRKSCHAQSSLSLVVVNVTAASSQVASQVDVAMSAKPPVEDTKQKGLLYSSKQREGKKKKKQQNTKELI